MRIRTAQVILLLAGVLAFAGCGGPQEIAFRTVAVVGGREPGAIVASDRDAFEEVWGSLPYSGAPPTVDEGAAVLGLSLGERPTGGYGVSIRQIHRIGNDHVKVWVELTEPGPDDVVTMVISYPGHLVAVSRDDLPRRSPYRLTIVDQHETILFETEIHSNP